MNPKNTWILVLLAGGLFAFIYFFERHIHGPPPVNATVLPGFKAAEVTSIQVQPLRQLEIRADATNGVWQLTHPLLYPAQGESVEKLLHALEDWKWQTRISAEELMGQPNSDEEYGFDAPQVTLIIQQGPDLRQIKLGNRTAPGDEVYVQVVGMEGVDIVSADILSLIPSQPNDWRNRSFADLADTPFDQVDITAGAAGFELQRDATNGLWRMSRPMPARVDNSKVDALLADLKNLRIGKFETDDPKADLDPLGLQPPQLELDLSRGTNQVLALQFGKSPTNDANLVYAKRGGQNTIVLVPLDKIAPWRAPATDFRDRHLVGPLFGGLDAIDIHAHGQDGFSVQRMTNNTWQLSPPGFPLDARLMQDFIQTLTNLQIVPVAGEFAVKNVVTESDLAGYGLADPVRKYILKRAITNSAGDLTNTVLVELDFGLKDTNVVARRPDESSVYAVKLEDFQRLPDSSLSLRKRQIWDFSVDNVTRVRIRQNGQSQELLHKGPNRWTVAAGSQGIINEFAVEAGAEELGGLAAEKWIEPGNQDRAKFGFSDRSIQFAVDVADANNQTNTFTLELGGWSADQRRYGEARVDGQNWIFEVPQNLLDRVLSDFNLHENAGP